MKREMPKIKRTRKLVITEKQAIGCPRGKDALVANMEEDDDDDVDSKLKKQIEISKQRMAMKYKKDTAADNQSSGHSTPLKSLENAMLHDKLQRKRRTPRKDLLEPTKGQSTPVNKNNDDPFGFDVLDSPLVFSPVLPSNNTSSSSSLQASEVIVDKRRSFGTYDIPIKPSAKTVVNMKKRKQKNIQPISAMEEWAEQINAEFDEVDNFQLTID